MFILSSISSGLEIWSANHTPIYESFELNVFENITFFVEISKNWPNYLLGIKVYKTLEFFWWILPIILQWVSTTSERQKHFHRF